jgi:hypothetical protein
MVTVFILSAFSAPPRQTRLPADFRVFVRIFAAQNSLDAAVGTVHVRFGIKRKSIEECELKNWV